MPKDKQMERMQSNNENVNDYNDFDYENIEMTYSRLRSISYQ